MKKFLWGLAAFCGLGVAIIAFFVMFADNWLDMTHIETARVGKQEVVVACDSGLDGDCIYKVGVRTPGASFIWVWSGEVNQQPQLSASADGAILALAVDAPTKPDQPQEKMFIQWNSLSTGGSASSMPNQNRLFLRHFSRQTEALLQQHGGVIELNFQLYDLGTWRWQDRDIKDLLAS